MNVEQQQLDPSRAEEIAGKVFGDLSGALTSVLTWLGDHLGLYRGMRGAGPLTSQELSDRFKPVGALGA